MICKQCNSNYDELLFDGIYVCREDGYKIENTNGDVILVINDTIFDSNDPEIGESINIKYCKVCNYWERV